MILHLGERSAFLGALLVFLGSSAGATPPPPPLPPPATVAFEGGTAVLGLPEDHPNWAPVFLKPTTRSVDAFWLDAHEVTAGAYGFCVEHGPCTKPAVVGDGCNPRSARRHPINCVTAKQADTFCSWRNGARLPTEAEWEYAARGPEGRLFPWGDTPPSDEQFHRGGGNGTVEVSSTPAAQTPQGVQDLSGNVWEWTSTTSSGSRVAKGGATMPSVGANRFLHSPDSRYWYVGFRCAGDGAPAAVETELVQTLQKEVQPAAPPRVLHWSELQPRVDALPFSVPSGAVKERVICKFDLEIDTGGNVVSASVKSCPAAVAEAAERALRASTYWPLDGPIRSEVPVFVDPG